MKAAYDSCEGYVATLNDPANWAVARARFKRYDRSYDSARLEPTPVDRSTSVCRGRRARNNRRDREAAREALTARSFTADRALQTTLDREAIPYLSSDSVVNPNDPSNYLPDTHFTHANDDRLAAALDRLITDRLGAGALGR